MARANRRRRKTKGPAPAVFAAAYYDLHNPVSFTGSAKDLAAAVGSTIAQAKHWLRGQSAYTYFRPARKRFEHERIFVQGLDEQWEIDLVSLIPLAPFNDGKKFLLTAVDALSKFAHVVPVGDKSGPTVARALAGILKNRRPRKIRSDLGKEFFNKHVQDLFKKHDIRHFGAYNYTKAGQVERFHRTLRARLWRYFHITNTQRYIEVLPKIVANYNNTVHTSTKMAPADVTVFNQSTAWNNLYGDLLTQRTAWSKRRRPGELPAPSMFRVGDLVRLSRAKHIFEKGHSHAWTKELFRIREVISPLRGVSDSNYKYRVEDLHSEPVIGSFQDEELQLARDVPRRVQRIVRRTRDGKFMSWRGYPQSLQTFLPKTES